jgi:hypothetical protein
VACRLGGRQHLLQLVTVSRWRRRRAGRRSAGHGVQSHGRVSLADMQPSRQGGLAWLPMSGPLVWDDGRMSRGQERGHRLSGDGGGWTDGHPSLMVD